ncbi:MAG: hypothetical protein ACE5HD_12790 [Acidobacteriota bacterium]
MRSKVLMVCLLAAACAASIVRGEWREHGEAVPDTAWRKSSGAFGALLLLTDEPETYGEDWKQPSSLVRTSKIESLAEAKRGDTIVAVVLFRGCAPNTEGDCDAEVGYRILKPDGGLYGGREAAELWKRPAPEEGFLYRGAGRLGLRIEAEDPLGRYRLEAIVRDRVAKVTLRLTRTLDVKESGT